MSSNSVVTLKNISKTYHVYSDPSDRLKQLLIGNKKTYFKKHHALQNINFNIEKGSSVGIIGRNGSGKSTLLQIIAGTLSPTSGEVILNGRVAALLELGSGFNPEFTGRENIYLYGSIYGISKIDMEAKFDDIEQFAEIGDFIDQPVKTYSSGMFVRLAFSVVINVDADILIIDEALSVGDMFFQAKCFDKLSELKKKGVTLLFVSHSMETIKALCNKCIVLKKGEQVFEGNPMGAADYYSKISLSSEKDSLTPTEQSDENTQLEEVTQHSTLQPEFSRRISERFGEGKARYTDAWIINEQNEEVDTVVHGNTYTFMAQIEFLEDTNTESEFGIVVRNQEGIEIYALNSFFKEVRLPAQKKGSLVQVKFKHKIMLAPGNYNVALGLRTPVQGSYNDKLYNGIVFRVILDYGKSYVPGLIEVPGEVSFQECRKL